jgi:HD-like signal output (HDOD) protein
MKGYGGTHPALGGGKLNGPATAVLDHRDLLASAEGLGALPVTVTKLASIVSNPDHEMREIVEVVSFDQALTATLLRRANSAALGARYQIKTVRDAAMWLGSGSLLSMALATNVSRRLNEPIPAYGLAEGQLWKQSVAASLAAEAIRAAAAVDVPAEAPTAALLHDFGKVVLAQHFGARVLNLLAQAAIADHLGLLDAETKVFGVNHADIGGLVAQQWKLPHSIVEAIIHHHHTGSHPTTVSATVSLAHAMVPEVLAQDGVDAAGLPIACSVVDNPAETHVEVMGELGIPADSYDDLLAAARQRFVDLSDRYDVG